MTTVIHDRTSCDNRIQLLDWANSQCALVTSTSLASWHFWKLVCTVPCTLYVNIFRSEDVVGSDIITGTVLLDNSIHGINFMAFRHSCKFGISRRYRLSTMLLTGNIRHLGNSCRWSPLCVHSTLTNKWLLFIKRQSNYAVSHNYKLYSCMRWTCMPALSYCVSNVPWKVCNNWIIFSHWYCV